LFTQIHEAAMASMRDAIRDGTREKDKILKSHDFEVALSKVSPSVSERVRLIPLYFHTHEI